MLPYLESWSVRDATHLRIIFGLHKNVHFLVTILTFTFGNVKNRSQGGLWALTSSWTPLGPFDFVLSEKAKTQAAAAEHKVSQLPKHLGQQRELVIEHLASQCANFVSGQPFHVQAVQRIIIKEAIEPIYRVRVT